MASMSPKGTVTLLSGKANSARWNGPSVTESAPRVLPWKAFRAWAMRGRFSPAARSQSFSAASTASAAEEHRKTVSRGAGEQRAMLSASAVAYCDMKEGAISGRFSSWNFCRAARMRG